MKVIQLGLVTMGRRPNTMEREVTECLLDVLYAPKPQQGIATGNGRKAMKVARKIEDAQDKERANNTTHRLANPKHEGENATWVAGVVMLEDEEHSVLKKACEDFLSVMPDHGLYEAFDRVDEAKEPVN